MTIAQQKITPVSADYDCHRCNDTGLTYEGSGHRMAGYPYAEKTVMASCNCAAGQRLDAQERGGIERERAAQEAADAHGSLFWVPDNDWSSGPWKHPVMAQDGPWLGSREFILIIVFLSVIMASFIGYASQAVWLDPALIY